MALKLFKERADAALGIISGAVFAALSVLPGAWECFADELPYEPEEKTASAAWPVVIALIIAAAVAVILIKRRKKK